MRLFLASPLCRKPYPSPLCSSRSSPHVPLGYPIYRKPPMLRSWATTPVPSAVDTSSPRNGAIVWHGLAIYRPANHVLPTPENNGSDRAKYYFFTPLGSAWRQSRCRRQSVGAKALTMPASLDRKRHYWHVRSQHLG